MTYKRKILEFIVYFQQEKEINERKMKIFLDPVTMGYESAETCQAKSKDSEELEERW